MIDRQEDLVRYTELLLNPGLDLAATAKRIATELPYIFMDYAVVVDPKLAAVEKLLRAEPVANFIAAIKLHRQNFNTGLKEAKDACEAIRERQGYVKPAYAVPTFGEIGSDWP